MATTYTLADAPTHALAKAVCKQFHPELADVPVTFAVVMATCAKDEQGDPKGAALRYAGHPAAMVVKINSYADRVEGKPDMTIKLDSDWVKEHSEAEVRALLDDAFMSVMLVCDDDGNVLADDAGRPRLRKRQTDYLLHGYNAVAQRHGEDSAEAQSLKKFAVSETGQMLMAWG